MHLSRKLQLASAAVIANGLVASILMSNIAQAATCSPKNLCYIKPACPAVSVIDALCNANAPPGCTLSSEECEDSGCSGTQAAIQCSYQSS